MKSPAELKRKLRRQWENADTRESRLLHAGESWPVNLSIGKPSSAVLRDDLDAVKHHVEKWRQVSVGVVQWESVKFRMTAESVKLPVQWTIRRPTEWIASSADNDMQNEFDSLSELVNNCDICFHNLLVRQRSLWRGKPLKEVIQATLLAIALEPGIAAGRPLRAISIEGIDTKFFERNTRLMTLLLDVRFDGEVSKLGLGAFLGAFVEGSHWLLLVDLDGSLLPFPKLRVASSDLKDVVLPGKRLLIVENESCHHQLPQLTDTIAILGAGFDLDWTCGDNVNSKLVGYWGDIDTWGLQFLGKARVNVPHLVALLMCVDVFKSHQVLAVAEPMVAGTDCPDGLLEGEQQLYKMLLIEEKGRLEQEFLPTSVIENALFKWLRS